MSSLSFPEVIRDETAAAPPSLASTGGAGRVRRGGGGQGGAGRGGQVGGASGSGKQLRSRNYRKWLQNSLWGCSWKLARQWLAPPCLPDPALHSYPAHPVHPASPGHPAHSAHLYPSPCRVPCPIRPCLAEQHQHCLILRNCVLRR